MSFVKFFESRAKKERMQQLGYEKKHFREIRIRDIIVAPNEQLHHHDRIKSLHWFTQYLPMAFAEDQLRKAEGEGEDPVLRRRPLVRGRAGRQRLLQAVGQNCKKKLRHCFS